MANGLYSRDEISRMTDDALDELLSHYNDTHNVEGAERVRDEMQARDDDREAEYEHELAEYERQRQHDEWLNETLIEDGRWG